MRMIRKFKLWNSRLLLNTSNPCHFPDLRIGTVDTSAQSQSRHKS